MSQHIITAALLAANLVLAGVAPVSAQVPSIIGYQGRVSGNGTNFAGTGFFKFALVGTAGTNTFWSNDGASTNGSEPVKQVGLSVAQGLFNVLLGDTNLTNMAAIPATVFTNLDVRLRIWFSDGAAGFCQLSPDQRIAAIGYAMMAANIPDGSVTAAKIASNAIGVGQITNLSITGSKIAANTIDITKLSFTPLTAETDPKIAVTVSNAVARWNGSVLTNGVIFDNGNVGIGTSNPVAKLDIKGALAINGTNIISASGQWVGSLSGIKGINWLGTWSSSATYTTNDAVQYNGSSFIALKQNSNVTPVAGATWSLLAAQGNTGPAGPSVSTSAVCVNGYVSNNVAHNGSCSCASKTISSVSGMSCTATSDTGSCTGTGWSGTVSATAACCVCGN
jgi:hypothetical protein